MDVATSRRIGKLAITKGWVQLSDVNEAFRIAAVREDIGERTSLDQVLFERGLLSAEQVHELQDRLKLRLVACGACGAQRNVYGSAPGSTVRCACKAKLGVPGNDPQDPFRCVTRQDRRTAREAARPRQTAGQTALGGLWLLGLGGALGAAAVGAWSGPLRVPALACAVAFAALALPLARRKQTLTASGLGLLLLTGLVVTASAAYEPGAVSVFGIRPHQLLGPLTLLHVGILFALGVPLLRRVQSPWAFLLLYAPLCYALLFFVSRCLPDAAPSTLVTGPAALERVPWYLHPGQVTYLLLFPLAALGLLGAGLRRITSGGQRTLLRDAGLVASLLLLAGFGLTLACLQGVVPAPGLRAGVDQALAGRAARWMDGGAKGSTAVAVQRQDAGQLTVERVVEEDS